jgi:hypothetical protein
VSRAREGGPNLASRALEALSALGLLFSQARLALERGLESFLRKAELIFVLYLWVSAGLFLALWGILDLLTEFTALPRGAIYLAGGASVSLSALLVIRLTQSTHGETRN